MTDDQNGVGSLLSLVESGGPVLIILIFLSVAAVAIILLKLFQFVSSGLMARRFADDAIERWQDGDTRRALRVLGESRSPVARVLETAMTGLAQHGLDAAVVREEVTRQATTVLASMRSFLRGLEVVVTLAPLLGLLGTVLGMIEAFQQLQAVGSRADPSVLAGGIWEALLTTAVGLSVAIPAAAALHVLDSVVERTRLFIEDSATQLFTIAASRASAGV